MRAAVARIEHDPGVSLLEVARLTGWCGRQLRRRFHEEVGYGVKTLQRVMRLQRFREMNCRALRRSLDLSFLAAHLGYADQAHMTREVGELAGITPAALRAIAPHMQQMSDPFVISA
jgi:AraC-like DNA-binding protein